MTAVLEDMVRVFIVEDSPLIRKRIVDSLGSLGGFEVIGFSESEKEAVAAIESDQPDIVITDIRLKEGNGIEVVRRTNLLPKARRPRIFVLSNYAYPEYKQECVLAGADDFFDKSSEYDRLLDAVRRYAH